ncbi:23S rRNA (adenine(2030)-N(6))-methyltransferase RlmJ [Tahibacter amnicola]|uniref:23S rRNA (Adenine(2030)-N(6))-methyltransferase RlmJ n=1 Tax=Tahibacter amnicola TaxID=2976241 RepID=A0ABY6BLY3_9GAMM|nr:23S rRNA (adenine(2030)-N(6))-methyltransferase RlmJ [Tahibacter amnicola]UXI69566.1 23S rRNA (adenine(2030)-N(6))-methyltransferase RlmJ [Tahibacter amnicola]
MRDSDRAQLCELQPDEASRLREVFRGDSRMAVHQRDGYEALKGLLPPREKRGLVLIDPPFEAQEGEFRAIEEALTVAQARWPTGVYAIWYPIKLRQSIVPFHRWLKESGWRKVLAAQLLIHPDNSSLRLNGTGMVILNTPWKFDRLLEEILPVLAHHLAQGRFGQHSLEWLVGD